MIKLNELIKKLCPNGVIYKTVGDICKISRGIVMSKDFIRDNAGDYPVYSSQTESNGELGKISTFMFEGEYLTWTTDGANAGSVFFRNGKFSVTNVCGLLKVIDKTINVKFLYYVLQTATKPYVNKGMGNAKLMSNVMAIVPVPVPPLEVQCEIVSILDNFTELTSELTSELAVRRKQFEYYLESLLSNKDTELVELNNVLLKTTNIKWNAMSDDNFYQYIDLSSVSRENGSIGETSQISVKDHPSRAQQIIKTNDILFGTTRPLLKRQTLIDEKYDGQICSTGFCVLRPNLSKVLPEWILFNIQTSSFYEHVGLNLVPGNYPSIPDSAVKKFKIPLPPINEQKRIILLLDSFNYYCNNISQGLPAEIQARQKQYEYYRDKLLSFKELES